MTVLQLVQREQSRLRSKLVMSAASMALAGSAIALTLGVLVLGGSRWISLPPAVPFLFWILLVVTIVLAIVQVTRLHRTEASGAVVATEIERERQLRDGSLRGVIELSGTSALARRASELMAGKLGTARGRLAPRMQHTARVRAFIGVGAALTGALALTAARGASPDGWQALTHPVSAWKGTLAAPLLIDAPSAVMRGEKVEILIAAAARRNVTLYHRSTGSAWREADYKVDEDANARAVLGPVDADLMLVAGDGRSLSDTVILRVTDRPFVGDVAIKAIFPKYLEKPDEALAIGEPATVPRGTVLEISGHASVLLAQVALVRDGTDTSELVVDGHRFRGKLAPRSDGQWTWVARGQSMHIQDAPPPLELRVVPDSAPSARILWPGGDTILAANDRLELELAANDDHSIQTVVLKAWKAGPIGQSRVEKSIPLAQAPGAAWSGISRLDLSQHDLKAGDELHVVLLATDGSPWAQTGSSRELVIRIPTSSEQRALARDAADSAVAGAVAAASAQRELEKKTGDASNSRDRTASGSQTSGATDEKKSMSYEAAEEAKSLAGAQREIEKQIDKLKSAAAEMEQQLRQAGALDSGLASRLAEARQMLNDALTQELRDQIGKLEEAAQKLSPDQARQSLSELLEQQKKLRQQLEKSAEMLKRAAFEGAMQTMSDEARELAAKEKAMADSLAKGSTAPKDGKELQAQSQALKNEMEELAKKLAEAGAEQGAKRTEEAAKQAQAALDALQKMNQSQAGQDPAGTQQQQQQRAGGSASQQQQQAGGTQQQRAGGAQQQQAGAQQQAGGSQQQQAGAGQQQQGGQQLTPQQQQQAQQNAQAAADAMQRAADEMSKARSEQIGEWKSEVTRELDRSIQEMQQLARQQERVEQQLRQGNDPGSLKGDQSAIQQGVQKVNERLQQTGMKSSLFSQQSQRAASDAQNKVQQATQQMSGSQTAGQTANAMKESAAAMQQAATALARDRERVNQAKSASGFTEMIEQMKQMAQQQGGLNSQSQGLLQNSGSMTEDQKAREAAAIAQKQREMARRLEELSDASGRNEALASEARRIAAALDAGMIDPATVQRQQQLFRRMLDAGTTLEQEERDTTGRRVAKAATGDARFVPIDGSSKGAPAVRFKEPGWEELRGLTADDRRAILEYFKRINGGGS